MKIASYIYISNTSPADVSQLWVKPEEGGNATLHVFTNGKWVPLGGVGESAYEAAMKEGFEGTKSEWIESLALKYSDLTAEQKTDLAKDAVSAAERAAQAVENIENTINDIDVSSTDGAITALAAKQGLLENELTALGPEISGVFASDSAVFASYRWVDVSALNLAIGDYIVVTNKSDTYKVYLRFAQADKTLLDSGNTTINVGESLLIRIAYANVGQLRFGGNMSASGQTAPFEVVYGGLDYLMSVAKQNETLRNGISTNVSNLNTVVDGVFASGQTQNAAYTWVDVSSLNLAVGDYLVIKNKSNTYNITLRFAKSDNTLIGATQSVASGTSALIKIVDENVAKLRFSANTSASGQSAAFDIISGGVSYLQRVVANKAESGDVLNKKELVFDVGVGTDLVAAFADEMVNSIPNYNNGKRQDNSTYQASGYIGVTEGTVIYVKHTNNQYIAPLACYSELPTNANEEEAYYMKSASIVGTGTAYDGNFTIPAGVKYVVMTYNPAFAAISQIIYTFISGRCYRIGSVAANLLNTSVVKTIAQTLPSATQQVVRNNIDAANAQDAVALKRPQFYARNIVSALQYKGECAIAKSYPLHWIDVMQRLNDRYAFGYSELAQSFTIPALNGYVDVEVTDASMFSNGKFIGIGTLDYYDVYIVMSITDNSMHLAKKQDNMGLAGETMSVTTELNRISGGASHLAKTMVFLTDDLKSYEANEMPYSLKGGDTVHPNATGFQYVADIIKESVLTRYPNVTRVIAFGDSWTAMPQAWPYYFNVDGVTVYRTTTAKSGYRIEQIMDLFATYMQTYTPQTGDVFVFLMGTNNLFDIYRKYASQEEVTPMQFMHDKNYVRTLRKACDTISQALPYGNWFIGGGHAICWSWGTNKDTDWA